MIPHIIHLTTKDGTLTRDEQIIFRNNKKIFRDWEFRIDSNKSKLAFIETNYPEFIEAYRKIKNGAMKADFVRYLYLHHDGGIYIDTDYQFIRPIPEIWLNKACVIPARQIKEDGTPSFGNCILFSEKGYPFWYDFIAYISSYYDLACISEDEIIACTGPKGITDFYSKNQDKYPQLAYSPQPMFHPQIVNHHLGVKKTPETIGIHYCFGSWRSKSNSPMRSYIYKFIQHLQARKMNIFNF